MWWLPWTSCVVHPSFVIISELGISLTSTAKGPKKLQEKKKKEKGFYTTSTKWPDMGIISAPKSFMEALGLIKKLSEHLSLHITKYNGLTSLKSNMHVFIIWMN